MSGIAPRAVSVLFNEPKLLKFNVGGITVNAAPVSVLFNEPKLLKSALWRTSETR